MKFKTHIFFIFLFCAISASKVFSDPSISMLWEKDITHNNRMITPRTIHIDKTEDTLRILGISNIFKKGETPIYQNTKLFEYRLNLKDNTSGFKDLIDVDSESSSPIWAKSYAISSQLINSNVSIIFSKYNSLNHIEFIIDKNWNVKTRELPGLNDGSITTLSAYKNSSGDIFLCGNNGYIRKIKDDGNAEWDINYKSEKGSENTLNVIFNESENTLVAFGCSFDSDTKFTTKNSSLWLANIDPKGQYKNTTIFEGICNFAKYPSFCLSKKGNPIVAYDKAELGSYEIVISKFHKDLNSILWTTPIFEGKDIFTSEIPLIPIENNHTLAVLFTYGKKRETSLYFYILNSSGEVVNKAVFKGIEIIGKLVCSTYKDRVFLTYEHNQFSKEKPIFTAKLLCFKIDN